MEDQRSLDVTPDVTAPVSQAGLLSDASSGALTQPMEPTALQAEPTVWEQARSSRQWVRWAVLTTAALLLLGGGVFVLVRRASGPAQTKSGDFGVVQLPLTSLARATNVGAASTLKVNGQLQVAGSLVLSPSTQPSSAVTGQLYYDKTANQLAYFNGQQFVLVAAGSVITNVTNIANTTNLSNGQTVIGSSAAAVLLQGTTPGTQQTGNLNISGAAKVGQLQTAVVTSNGSALYFNPVDAGNVNTQQNAPGTPGTAGLTTIGATITGTGIQGELLATKATMGSNNGAANSITVYLGGGSAAKHIQVALYEDDGDVPDRPANLLSTSASTAITPNAFNTIAIPQVALSANNTYWLAFNTDDTTVTRAFNGASKGTCFYGKSFGVMPDPFAPGPCFFADEQYTIYVNYTVTSGPGGTTSPAMFTLGNTGQALFQNTVDSTSAFQVQNASGSTTLFNIDTLNGRVAIGKASANYRLDIGAGDINVSNGHSLRFAGSPTLSVNAAGDTTSVSSFASGGKVVAQASSFVVQDANGFHQNLVVDSNGAAVFSNGTNTTAGFQVQNATGTALLTADTSNMNITIGNASGSASPVILYLANKNTSGDPLGAEGGMYYNGTLGSFRCFYSGFWHNCGDIEPQHGFSAYDEFLGGQASFSGPIGSLDWTAAAIGANGSLAFNPATPAPSADRPGVLRVQTPAVSNEGTTLLLGDTGGGSMIIGKDNDVKTAVATGAATGQVLRVGLHGETTATTQPLSGVWWEADPSANANWRFCYGDGATATCTPTAVAIAANVWVTLEIRVTATGAGASAATFIINGTAFTVSGVTIDTTGRVSPALSCYATTAAAQNCYWDYFQLTGTTTAIR